MLVAGHKHQLTICDLAFFQDLLALLARLITIVIRCGSFVGISSAVLLGLDFKYVRLGLWGLNSAICFSVIAGMFHSYIMRLSAGFEKRWLAFSAFLNDCNLCNSPESCLQHSNLEDLGLITAKANCYYHKIMRIYLKATNYTKDINITSLLAWNQAS